jgi:hypothetical protein
MKSEGYFGQRFQSTASSRWFVGGLRFGSTMLVALLTSDRLESAVMYVQPSGADAFAGTSWPTAKRTVTAALTVAQPGDEIWVAAGTYFERISLRKDVALYAGFAGSEMRRDQRDLTRHRAILDGAGGGTVVRSEIVGIQPNTRLDGFVVRNGLGVMGSILGNTADYSGLNSGGGIHVHLVTCDADGDGFLDRFEYFTGTHPRDPESCLRLLSTTPTHGSHPRPMVSIASNLIRNPQSHR